jgi:amino acid transporter
MGSTSQLTQVAEVRKDSPRLRGNLGVFDLFFSVMAYNAPLVIVIGVIPVMVAVGNGIGTPMVFVVCGLIIAAFAVGFTRMARVAPNPGAFYSYITSGLGKEIGLGAGFIAALSYFCCYTGTFAFGGTVLGSLVENSLNGPHLPWWVWALVFWAGAGILGYLKVQLSARVLSLLLLLELIVIVAYDAAIFLAGGGEAGLPPTPFISPDAWFSGSIGLALLFGIGMFGGFEVTALFRDEVKDPKRTVPRATYAVIAVVVAMYALTAWLFIGSQGIDVVVGVTQENPTAAMESSILNFGGRLMLDLATAMVNTSTFAVLLAAHNITSRYLFNLSADGILHGSLSRVHSRFGSPYVASIVASVAALVVGIPFVLLGTDALVMYAAFIGITSFTLIFSMFVTNLAIVIYMRRHHKETGTVWNQVIAPTVAGVGLGTSLVLAAVNFPLLIGGSNELAAVLFALMAGIFLLGVVLAIVYRKRRPDVYARIGRQ